MGNKSIAEEISISIKTIVNKRLESILESILKKKNINNNEKQEFKNIIKIYGSFFHVLRTVKKNKFNDFCEYILTNIDNIEKGKFDFFKEWNKKKSVSYLSKICHVINPEKYPIIYDSNTNKKLQFKNFEDYKNKCTKYLNEHKKEYENIFELDSSIWASIINENK